MTVTPTHAKLLSFWKTNPTSHLADRLGVSSRQVAEWRAEGRIPADYLRVFRDALLRDFGLIIDLRDLQEARNHMRWLGLYKSYADFAKAMGVAHTTARWWRERGRRDRAGRPMGRVPALYWPRFRQLLQREFSITVTMDELRAAYVAAAEDTRREVA